MGLGGVDVAFRLPLPPALDDVRGCDGDVEGHVLLPVVKTAVSSTWLGSVNEERYTLSPVVESAFVLAPGYRLAAAARGLLATCPGRKPNVPAHWMPDSFCFRPPPR